MMACGPLALFFMHFSMNLNRETAANLLEMLQDVRHSLRVSLGMDVEDDVNELEEVAIDADTARKEEPMWTLSTDSPRVIKSLRRKALDSGLFTFVFGCAAHSGHNLCVDWLKLPKIEQIVSANVFVVNKINSVHLLTSMFDVCCVEELHKTYSLIMCTKTRWCTVLAMLKRNLLVKSVLINMPHAIDHDGKFEDVAMEDPVRNVILDVQH